MRKKGAMEMKILLLKILNFLTMRLAESVLSNDEPDKITHSIEPSAPQEAIEPLSFEVTVNGDFKVNIFEPDIYDSYIRMMLQDLSDSGEIPEEDYFEIDDIVFKIKSGVPPIRKG